MDASDFTPERNKIHVGEGLDELHRALKPFVEKRMKEVYGKEWRAKAVEILKQPVGEDFDEDPKDVLLLILKDYGRFAKVLKSDGRTFISDLLNTRHHWAHHKFDIKRTFHVYECLCTVLERLKHDAPAITARRAVLHSLVAEMAPPPPDAVAASSAADTIATDSGGDSGDRGATDHEHESAIANGPTLTPWVATDDGGDGVPVVPIFKKKGVITVAVIGFLTTLALIQLKTSENAPPPPPPPPTPEVASISPAMPTSQANAQTVRILGRGFRTGLRLVLELPGGGSSILSGTQIQDLTDTSFAVVDAPLTVEGRYALSVENSDSSKSNLFVFTVATAPRRENRSDTTNPIERMVGRAPSAATSAPLSEVALEPAITGGALGLSFELMQCRLFGTSLRCDFFVTNELNDRSVRVDCGLNYGGSKAFDNEGNEIVCDRALLANKRTTGVIGDGVTLVTGVRTRLQLTYEKVRPSAQTLSLMSVDFADDSQRSKVEFRSVSIARPQSR